MESERLNRWLTLGANLGVLIGILLLVFELNQNRDLVRVQIRNELSQGVIDLLRSRAENEQLADILFRAENGEELSPLESSRYTHFHRAFFRYVANVQYQYRQGLYDDSEYGVQRDAWGFYLGRIEPAVNVWCEYRATVSIEVQAEINSLLTTYQCES